jgi:hypothetical protein
MYLIFYIKKFYYKNSLNTYRTVRYEVEEKNIYLYKLCFTLWT